MKAFLLAAGLGTRLRPVIGERPKCLAPIGGVPMLAIWLDLLGRSGVKEVLLNSHYQAGTVTEFAETWTGAPKLTNTFEEHLLGSAGTLAQNWSFVEGESDFLVCYADNLTDMDLGKLIQFHRGHQDLVTMTLFRTETPTQCGIVETAPDGRVVSFEEKPAVPKSNLANAGVYVMRAGIRELLPEKIPADIGFDLLPRCMGSMRAWTPDCFLMDMGTPQTYAAAQEQWAKRNLQDARP